MQKFPLHSWRFLLLQILSANWAWICSVCVYMCVNMWKIQTANNASQHQNRRSGNLPWWCAGLWYPTISCGTPSLCFSGAGRRIKQLAGRDWQLFPLPWWDLVRSHGRLLQELGKALQSAPVRFLWVIASFPYLYCLKVFYCSLIQLVKLWQLWWALPFYFQLNIYGRWISL